MQCIPASRPSRRFGGYAWLAASSLLVLPVQLPLAAPTPATPDAGGTNQFILAFLVLDATNNRPIGGATITAAGVNVGWDRPAGEATFLTDAAGTATVTLPARVAEAHWLSLSVQHSNYASRGVTWQRPDGPGRAALPTRYTIKLGRGLSIGGFVREENGRPVAGATVIPWGSEASAGQPAPASNQPRESSSVPRVEPGALLTDTNGFWKRDHFPADADRVWVEIVRPGGARAQFQTGGQARNYPGSPFGFGELDLKDLQATQAVCVLKEGVAVRGIVVDEAGQPVAGARLRERELQPFMPSAPYTVTTGADGRFELLHRTGPQLAVSAEAERYAIRSIIVPLGRSAAEPRIVLQTAQPARLRVLDERERALAGASVRTIEWRNRGQLLEWDGRTDGEGRVVWTNAPREKAVVMVTASNYPARAVTLVAGAGETLVRLRPGTDRAIVVRVRVSEDKTGRSIPGCEISRSMQYQQGFTNWGRAGNDGVFQAELTAKAFPQGYAESYTLMVVAEGYGTWTGEMIYFDEGDQDLTVTLKRARAPAGVVLRPDGQPAADAKVILNTTDNAVYSYRPGQFDPSGPGYETQRTGADGSFHFKAAAEQHRLLVTHPSGIAALTVGALPATGNITLQPWGRIEGVLRYAGRPLAQENVSIKWPITWDSVESHHLNYSARTDSQGRFVFSNLPPGEFVLYRMPRIFNGRATTESHRRFVEVKGGGSTQIDYTLGGRTVTGHVEADGPVDWKNDPHLLEAKAGEAPAQPAFYAYLSPAEYKKARKTYAESPETLRWERAHQQFLLLFDGDGNFRADDVVPGTYELRLRVTKPPAKGASRGWYGNEEELGTLTRTVTVPPGAVGTEVDLGSFDLALKAPGVPRGAPLVLRGVTLTGRPFDLADLRGRPVVLLFWATWAPASVARLAELREASSSLGANSRAAFLTVNLDEDTPAAQRSVEGLDRGWTHARLEGASRAEVTERLEVDTLPSTLLLNSEGIVAARDVTGKRLPALLDRLARPPGKK